MGSYVVPSGGSKLMQSSTGFIPVVITKPMQSSTGLDFVPKDLELCLCLIMIFCNTPTAVC